MAAAAVAVERAWRLLPFTVGDAAAQMRRDWQLFVEGELGGVRPTVRLYRWGRPAVSYGCHQEVRQLLDLERCWAAGLPAVRRPTGGGLVLHGGDLTYVMVGPRCAPRLAYEIVHGAVVRVLQGFGVRAALVDGKAGGTCRHGGVCASAPVCWDVVVGGRKLAGAAVRRGRRILLLQGYLSVLRVPVSAALRQALGDGLLALLQAQGAAGRDDGLRASFGQLTRALGRGLAAAGREWEAAVDGGEERQVH